MLILQIKPYIAERFQAWGNVWAYSSSLGYQQTRAMSAAASGGFFGMGPGTGWLVGIGAADTDLVFGVLCEEWGLLIALICVICLISLTLYSYRCSKAGRSSFLYYCFLCGNINAFVSNVSEYFWMYGHSSVDRGYIPIRKQRWNKSDIRLDAYGVY